MQTSNTHVISRKNLRRRRRRQKHIKFIAKGVIPLALLLVGAKLTMDHKLPSMLHKTPAKEQALPLKENTVIVPKETTPENSSGSASLENSDSGVENVGADSWKLRLVNQWNPIPADYTVSLTKLKYGHAVDKRCYPDLQKMMDDCRAAGLSPMICSSYRTEQKQTLLYKKSGKSKNKNGQSVAAPGTSEHQLGLALDIVDKRNQNLNKSQENTAVQKWLMKNSWKYGFILRYPNNKSDITGIIYEPWHYRYVGKEAAKEIYERGICLEEYLNQIHANPNV